ncbi:MAG: hypothetical protein V4661_03175 [Pseudomonadota bacterium]
MFPDFEWKTDFKFCFDEASGKLTSPERKKGISWSSDRIIYILKFSPPYYVNYKKGKSAVCYIGQGATARRIAAHRETWFQKVAVLLEGFQSFDVTIGRPRVKNNLKAYKKVEGDAVWLFKKHFGEQPLFNQNTPLATAEYSQKMRQGTLKIFKLAQVSLYSKEIRSLETRKSPQHG